MVITEWTNKELLRERAKRPHLEPAWQEFARRFRPAIRGYVLRAIQLAQHGSLPPKRDVDDLVEQVHGRLVEPNGQALKLAQELDDIHISQYLLLLSANVVGEYLQGKGVRSKGGLEPSRSRASSASDIAAR
ncbi:MAG TPA: hypothetical protein VNO70_22220 [Blastocatellia bacterium]|nr:hypothetical protein [Blastocatellia bacterium]